MLSRNKFLSMLCSVLVVGCYGPNVGAAPPEEGNINADNPDIASKDRTNLNLAKNSDNNFSHGVKDQVIRQDCDPACRDLISKYTFEAKGSTTGSDVKRAFAGRMTDTGKKIAKARAVVSVFGRDKKFNAPGVSVPVEDVDRILNALRDLARTRRNPKISGKYLKVVNDAIFKFKTLRDENRAKYYPNRIWVPYTLATLLVGVAATLITLVEKGKIGIKNEDPAIVGAMGATFLAFLTVLIGNSLVSSPACSIAGYEGLIEFLKECVKIAKGNANNLGTVVSSDKKSSSNKG